MSKGINKALILGHVGQDPKTSSGETGRHVASLSIATSDSWKDKVTGEKQERTEWHRIVFFGRLAEVVEKYVTKGSLIYVEGSIRTRKWQDKTGADRFTTEIVAEEMQMLGGPKKEFESENVTAMSAGDFPDDDVPF